MDTCRIDEVMSLLDSVGEKFLNMRSDTASEDVLARQNVFTSLPRSMASLGVVITSMTPNNVKDIKNLVFIPKGGEIKPHFHTDHEEIITVLSGCVNYKMYKTDAYKVVTEEGTICLGDQIIIDPNLTHYVFTTDEESYLQVEFKRIDGE